MLRRAPSWSPSSTACWRGYTARWAIELRDGRPMLVMLGFDCDEYLPLCEPYLNPITGTLRVVPEGAELLHYEHMGFESKYAGELNLRFVAGELVGVEPIADAQQPQDGLLDLAELGPGGKEGWLERQWKRLRGYEPKPIPADVNAMLEMDESKPRPNVPCAVCGAIVAEAPWEKGFEAHQIPRGIYARSLGDGPGGLWVRSRLIIPAKARLGPQSPRPRAPGGDRSCREVSPRRRGSMISTSSSSAVLMIGTVILRLITL